jgi:Rrf2 family protein
VKLTRRGELAIKAMLELAKVEEASPPGLPAGEIARRCGASLKFLEQVLLTLRSGGLVVSRRGPLGGYRLARDADAISVGDISRLVDGPLAPAPCASLTQHRRCDWCVSEAECELKPLWGEVRDALAQVMDGTSLGALVRQAAAHLPAADRYQI